MDTSNRSGSFDCIMWGASDLHAIIHHHNTYFGRYDHKLDTIMMVMNTWRETFRYRLQALSHKTQPGVLSSLFTSSCNPNLPDLTYIWNQMGLTISTSTPISMTSFYLLIPVPAKSDLIILGSLQGSHWSAHTKLSVPAGVMLQHLLL